MPNTEDEKKGIVYEAFVKLAVQKALNITLLWEKNLPGVIANQDFVYPSVDAPTMVFAVTHWGSHEAANKKYWRTIEDRCEVYNAFPDADFYSILFEKNINSDDALDEQLRYICFGRALSERNSPAIVRLQQYVSTDEKVKSFGTGKDNVYATCLHLFNTNIDFASAINDLGIDIQNLNDCSRNDYPWCIEALDRQRAKSELRRNSLAISSVRDTYYKMAIIKLLRFSDTEIREIVNSVVTNRWDTVSEPLLEQLVALKLIRFVGIANRVVIDPILSSIAAIGADAYNGMKNQISQLVQQPNCSFHAYHDHFVDITVPEIRNSRYDFLFSCNSSDELLEGEYGIGGNTTTRAWVLDYYLALKRELTPRKKYGFQRLSTELGIQYTAGGIVSPLPRYASGLQDSITNEEKMRLYQYMFDDIQQFNAAALSPVTITNDRTVTLMKKLNVIELLIENSLVSLREAGYSINPSYRIYSPIRSSSTTASAGATDYNFLVTNGSSSVLIFVVSAYDASHKHKELSGRLRLAQASQEFPTENVACIIVYDGTLFGSSPDNKLSMLYQAGWDRIYYIDELEQMSHDIGELLA